MEEKVEENIEMGAIKSIGYNCTFKCNALSLLVYVV